MTRQGMVGLKGLVVCLALLCVSIILFAPDNFLDNRYNLGVARRSALPIAQHILETSMTFMHYEFYPTPRPEDWHRGLSVLALSWWARLFGGNETLMRVSLEPLPRRSGGDGWPSPLDLSANGRFPPLPRHTPHSLRHLPTLAPAGRGSGGRVRGNRKRRGLWPL